ncbi:hypothetical protein PQQ87_22280 [Paraburkholderia nemoris]|uniref:hypothetical protein n=1 Tax=Paraburkholderia nemoris TaxID=2793076 RepID=UPI0038BA6ACA
MKTKKANKKATACRGFHDSNCLRRCAARIRDEASGAPKGAASGDVGVRTGCGSCAKEYDKESAGVNHEFALGGYFLSAAADQVVRRL